MTVLMQERPRVQVQRVALPQRGQTVSRARMQPAQNLTTLLGEHAEEPAQGGLAGDGFDAQHLRHGGMRLQTCRRMLNAERVGLIGCFFIPALWQGYTVEPTLFSSKPKDASDYE